MKTKITISKQHEYISHKTGGWCEIELYGTSKYVERVLELIKKDGFFVE